MAIGILAVIFVGAQTDAVPLALWFCVTVACLTAIAGIVLATRGRLAGMNLLAAFDSALLTAGVIMLWYWIDRAFQPLPDGLGNDADNAAVTELLCRLIALAASGCISVAAAILLAAVFFVRRRLRSAGQAGQGGQAPG